MKQHRNRNTPGSVTLVCMALILGCGGNEQPAAQQSAAADAPTNSATAAPQRTPTEFVPTLPTISLGGGDPTAGKSVGAGPTEDERRRDLLDAMKPLQIMLGSWKGTTQKNFGDFKALDEPEWVWDFQSDPAQPAMVMSSEGSPYFRELRLTYLTGDDIYRLTVVPPEGPSRTLTGSFSQPVEEFQGDDKRLHRRYKLELTERNPADEKDAWQVVLNQQENNRYLVELSKVRGSGFMRFDTVATQRQGTSFALSDEGYGEKACIITGGLGTSTVSYQGKTYWVCCSGCRAAFEENPEKWIAAAAKLGRGGD